MSGATSRMQRKPWVIAATFLFACGLSASASADWNSCVAICHSQLVDCVRNHGGAKVCEMIQTRCEFGCLTINPNP